MPLEDRLQEDMNLAMKAGRKEELGAIRLMRAQLKDARIDKKDDLTEQEVVGILQKAAKKRKESIEIYDQGNRPDLVEKETFELGIIQRYLPEQISDDAIVNMIDKEIAALNLNSEKDIGRLMGALMPKVKGIADGKVVQNLAKEALVKIAP